MATRFVGKTIAELKVRDVTGANIIGVKLSGARYVFNPDPDLKLSRNDQLFVIGSPEQISILKAKMESDAD
jgi:voltage-gated potassium channel